MSAQVQVLQRIGCFHSNFDFSVTHLEVDVPVVAPLDVEAGEARDARPREVAH